MRVSHRPPRVVAISRRRKGERGFILAKFALLLVPLLLMSGLSVDVGFWYNEAADIQKAADAAALAGVVWLPDEAKAEQYAREAATRNGYTDGVDGIEVEVEPVPGRNRRLKVTIHDTSVGSFFFENLGGYELDMTRDATAEYILPVPLGSPENVFGTDLSLPAAQRMNLWGNIHGPRTNNKKGDAYAPMCRDAEGGSCGGNGNYRSGGYLYAIDVPTGVTGMNVQVYDAGLAHRTSENIDTGDTNYAGDNNANKTTTTWTFYERDATEIDVTDNPIGTSATCTAGAGAPWTPNAGQARWTIPEIASSGTSNFKNTWRTLCTKSGTVTPGRYLLRVQTSGPGTGASRYSVRVTASSATKPRLSAYQDMSMYNNISSGSANFYLAEVGPEHKGKTLEVRLYDPGEVSGDAYMQVVAPSGETAPSCRGMHDGAAGGGKFATGSTLTPCRFQTASATQSARYDGVWVTLQIAIPADYSCTPGTIPGCWWKIRYEISGQANDTTTWAANVIGDPVHLVEEEAA